MTELFAWMNTNQGVSGWAQALGSFVALYVAIWFPISQQKREAAKAKSAEIERRYTQINFVWGTVTTIVEELEKTREYLVHERSPLTKSQADHRSVFDIVLMSFDAFPIHDLNTGPLVVRAIQLRRDSHKVVNLLAQQIEGAIHAMQPGCEIDLEFFDKELCSLKLQLEKWAEDRSHWFKQVYPTK